MLVSLLVWPFLRWIGPLEGLWQATDEALRMGTDRALYPDMFMK